MMDAGVSGDSALLCGCWAKAVSVCACAAVLGGRANVIEHFKFLGSACGIAGITIQDGCPTLVCRSVPSTGLGPQYNRMRLRGHGLQAQPFEVSPALRIAGAGVRPHSLASLAGPFSEDSSGLDMWGVSLGNSGTLPDTHRSGGSGRPPPGGGTPTAAGAAASDSRRLAATGDRAMSSFSKYKMYYSGFDVGVTPPIAVATMPRGSASSGGSADLSNTPRPGEFANTVGQDWCA